MFGSIRDGAPIKNAVQSTFERGLARAILLWGEVSEGAVEAPSDEDGGEAPLRDYPRPTVNAT